MLPTPAIRATRQPRHRSLSGLGGLARAIDRYTLWAFNPPRGRR